MIVFPAPVVDPRSGVLIPPECAICEKKPILSYGLFLKYGGEGGIDSLRSPCGQPVRCASGLSNGLRPLSTPVGGSHPPGMCNMRKKSPYFRTGSFSNMAVRGGLTRFARPAGSPFAARPVCPTGCARCRPRSGVLIPPECAICEKKAHTFVRALSQIWR